MMRHNLILTTALIGILMLAGCKSDSEKNDNGEGPVIVEVNEIPQLSEVSGTIGEGTMKSYLELLADNGDTLDIRYEDAFRGGSANPGDRVYITYQEDTLNQEYAAVVMINLNQLERPWRQFVDGEERTLHLQADGSIVTNNMKTDYKKWKMKDAALLMTYPLNSKEHTLKEVTDTFQITMLSADTLKIAHEGLETVFAH